MLKVTQRLADSGLPTGGREERDCEPLSEQTARPRWAGGQAVKADAEHSGTPLTAFETEPGKRNVLEFSPCWVFLRECCSLPLDLMNKL